MAEIESLWVCATVAQTSGPKGAAPTVAYGLNEEHRTMALLTGQDEADPSADQQDHRSEDGKERRPHVALGGIIDGR
jgi:hypothetical protein